MGVEAAVFHDKHLIGNGEGCRLCGGEGRVPGPRGRTFRRCKPCKGSGRAPLPAEVIVANTRPRGAQAALVREARDAREAAEINNARIHAEAALKTVETPKTPPGRKLAGLPLPFGHGLRLDGSTYITCGDPEVHGKSFTFSGSAPEALAFAQALNAIPDAREFFADLLAACRDNENDVVVPSALIERIAPLIIAFGGRP